MTTLNLKRRVRVLSLFGLVAAALVLACDHTDLTAPPPPPGPLTASVTSLFVSSVSASGHQDPNVPQNTLDNNLATRWSAEGDGQWIQYDLGALTAVGRVDIAWYQDPGNPQYPWESAFDIEVSPDAVTWTRVFSGRSTAGNAQPEGYGFSTVTGRYVRIVGHGQWDGATLDSWWNSITEVDIYSVLPVTSVVASGNQVGNVPENTLDNSLGTRWSHEGDGQWIRYDLGAPKAIGGVDIAWYQASGQTWESVFDIEVSTDAVTWTKVFSGRSSAGNLQYQRYEFSTVTCRYVRIVGHGQWNGATNSSWWNSITEVDIHPGSGAGTCPEPVTLGVNGLGTLGAGSATPGSDRQEFDFDVAANLSSGRLFYRDWAVVRADGTVGTLTVNPADPSTAITAYRDWASACADPTRGAVFEGTGRLDTGSLTSFTVATCDNGAAGSGADFFQMDVPPAYSKSGFLSSGNVGKSETATVIFQDGFENGLSSWWEENPAAARYSVTTTAARVKSGTHSLQVLFAPGNTWGMLAKWFMPGYDEIYVRFHVMFEEGFDERYGLHFVVLAGNRTDDSGSSFGKPGIKPNGTDFFYAGLDPEFVNGDAPLKPFHFYTYWPDMTCGTSCFGNRFYQTAPKIPLVAGVWQEVLFHVKLNTPGQSNGSQTLWINGVKKIEVQNLRWRTTTDLRLNQLRFDNYMSQGPKTEYLWVDDVTVWRP